MKLRFVPKCLSNLPLNYKLDTGDYQAINKYREEISTKRRKQNKTIITWKEIQN